MVVDADFRRPRLHEEFGVRRLPGITELLFEDVMMEEALQSTPFENLSILSVGNRLPNPPAITQSQTFLSTIKSLEESFDYVLIDTAPYGIITDASAIIKQTDGVVMVTRFNDTSEADQSHVFNSLTRVEANILGTVLSDFDHEQTSDYYYSSQYYREIYAD